MATIADVEKVDAGRGVKALKCATIFWFAVTALGQWIFLAYVLAVYGGPLLANNLPAWNDHFSSAFIPGNWLNNISAIAHMALAVVILGGGPLQLIPQIRSRYPTFHRWLGRSYLVALVVTAVAGLYLLANRDVGGLPMKLGFILQGVLILWFAVQAYRRARARRFVDHRRWALRLFMVASAVWYFRILMMIWVALTGGVGLDFETGKGWFLDMMSFGQYLPLLLLELYFRTTEQPNRKLGESGQLILAGCLAIAGLATALGVAMATLGMWLPEMV
ncbi:MAG: DUF2306 domain-containing protein [Parasphingorhabdus sp.]|uniref:DUF2306 domain-containing protein n=1 Tax=Parasphingorhabdus sp. TaxID=2709688 RepID=UPI003298F0EB